MGLRCSLIGHDFGELEVDQNRQERGSEVVTTVTEFKRCHRCGTTKTVSENTEITSMEQPVPSDDRHQVTPEESAEGTTQDPIDQFQDTTDDGIILEDDDEIPERGYGEWPESTTDQSATDEVADENEYESTDSGTILEDSSTNVGDHVDPTATEPVEKTERSFATAGEARSPAEPDFHRDVPTEYYCPNCGSAKLGQRHSLRTGDICPECRAGYVAEREI